ncbi:maltose/maltodextrin ABC transporter substrate-binding protein MalE [Scandinavium sp. H11S7]|uniref:Maltodextrin-binding protein n=1 Tax=Scandinavium hiltneri TaxID=2926519 RepID=A0ABT2E6Y6_9ENTR|nr:maltose/maltodextrin ABC transporter substrate-binding protein MalE [Scandinavium hiltneri]MCS2163651.1 maltose/maltodextrin ABC transporter substrate-binding protein MalE [Scandinavium hiltneri]
MKKLFLTTLSLCCMAAFAANAEMKAGNLVIWGGNPGEGRQALENIGKQFEADTGVHVTVEHPKNMEEIYPMEASNGGGPDIIMYAHDRFGGYAKAGLLAEVNTSQEFKDKISSFAWDAVKYNGKLIGYPMSIEALTLIYNKKLVSTPPKTWEEIPALNQKLQKNGKKAIIWNLAEPYFSWPLIASAGGYAFKPTKDGYDINDVGVNNKGSVSGLSFIVAMIKSGALNPDTDYPLAESSFIKGESAMTINGPWSWANIEKSGIDYGVTTIPTFQGKPAKPFVGVVSIGINAASPNKDLATEFIEHYLLTDKGLEMLNKANPLGAVALKSYQEQLNKDPRIQATMLSAQNGDVMPNIPQMGGFWYAEKAAIINAINQKQTPQEALDAAAQRIKSANK